MNHSAHPRPDDELAALKRVGEKGAVSWNYPWSGDGGNMRIFCFHSKGTCFSVLLPFIRQYVTMCCYIRPTSRPGLNPKP